MVAREPRLACDDGHACNFDSKPPRCTHQRPDGPRPAPRSGVDGLQRIRPGRDAAGGQLPREAGRRGGRGVSRVSGLRRTTDIVEYRSGTGPDELQRLPGKVVWEPFTLERPLGADTGFEDWATAVGQGATASWRKNVRRI